jgi:hypothetical protein
MNKNDLEGINAIRIRHASWPICTPAPTQENDGRLVKKGNVGSYYTPRGGPVWGQDERFPR